MHSDAQIAAIADWIIGEHAAGRRYQPLPATHAIDRLDDAYRVQALLPDTWVASRGALAGYKIALTSKPIQELCGVDQPIAGRLYAKTIQSGPATISLNSFGRLGLEFELAVRLAAPLPATDGPWTSDNVRPYVASIAPAFELIEDRNADYGSLDACSMIADNAWSGGVILGQEVSHFQTLDLANMPVTLTLNGQSETSVTGAAMGNPLTGLAWIANLLNSQDKALQSGDLVITGSTLATRFANAGDTACYQIAGLGDVELSITD
jgi:2-keto-4-pentenoate hydratase